jgi:hypothetical protein
MAEDTRSTPLLLDWNGYVLSGNDLPLTVPLSLLLDSADRYREPGNDGKGVDKGQTDRSQAIRHTVVLSAKTRHSAVETAFHKAADRISTLVGDNQLLRYAYCMITPDQKPSRVPPG